MKTKKSLTTILIFIIAIMISSCASTYSTCPSYTLSNSDNSVTN